MTDLIPVETKVKLTEDALKRTIKKIGDEKALAPKDYDKISFGIGLNIEKDATGKPIKSAEFVYFVFFEGQPYRQIQLSEILE